MLNHVFPALVLVLAACAAAGAPGAGPNLAPAPPPEKPRLVAADPSSSPPPSSVAVPPPAGVPSVAVAPEAAAGGPCKVPRPPLVRTGGDLLVDSPPRAPTRNLPSRLRTHTEGALTAGSRRVWVGPEVPPFVFLSGGTRELFLLDETPDGFLALYRDPYNASSCTLSGSTNCSVGVALFECSGRQRWLFLLDPLLSRPEQLEVQDIRYADGVLYFNEACQSYSNQAGGRCSSLVALDPLTQKVLWRTTPRVSNQTFLVHQRYLITGYGFTSEPDALFVVRRSDGKIMQKVPVQAAHEGLSLDESGQLTATLYGGKTLRFRTEGFDGDKPRLVPLP